MLKKILTISLLLLIFSCGAPQKEEDRVPVWISDPYIDFNKEEYFAAVGRSESKSKAELEAQKKIWQIIAEELSYEKELWTEFINLYQKINPGKKATQLYDFSHAEFVKDYMKTSKEFFHSEKGDYYVLDILNRRQTSNELKKAIKQKNALIYDYYQEYLDVKTKFNKLRKLQKAIQLTREAEYLNYQLKIISPTNQNLNMKIDSKNLLEERKNFTNIIKIGLISKGLYAKSLDNFIGNLCKEVGFSLKQGDKSYVDFIVEAELSIKLFKGVNQEDILKWELLLIMNRPKSSRQVIFSRDGQLEAGDDMQKAQMNILEKVRSLIYTHFYNFFINNF